MHNHSCCGHGRSDALALDDGFADDDFAQAALDERRAHAAHAHGASVIALLLGGFLVVGIGKMLFGRRG